MIVYEALALEQQERLNLLFTAARNAPSNDWLWGTVWTWIQRCHQKKEQRGEVLAQLYQAGCRADSILIPLLECLSPEEARVYAKQWLTDNKDKEVLCRCLDLLGQEAKNEAKKLLADSKDKEVLCRCLDLLGQEARDEAKKLLADSAGQTYQVLCRCLDLLGQEAKTFAVERIRFWHETDARLLVRCFQLAGETPEAQNAAAEMLSSWDERVPPLLRVAALRASFDTPLRLQRAREVLEDWHRQYRPLVAGAMTAFWNDPDAVTGYCRAIINS